MHRFTCTSQKFHKEGVFISRERYRTQMLMSLAQSHTTFPGGSDLKPDPSDYVVSGMFHCYVGNDNNMAQGHRVPSHTCNGCQKLIMTFLCGATLCPPQWLVGFLSHCVSLLCPLSSAISDQLSPNPFSIRIALTS